MLDFSIATLFIAFLSLAIVIACFLGPISLINYFLKLTLRGDVGLLIEKVTIFPLTISNINFYNRNYKNDGGIVDVGINILRIDFDVEISLRKLKLNKIYISINAVDIKCKKFLLQTMLSASFKKTSRTVFGFKVSHNIMNMISISVQDFSLDAELVDNEGAMMMSAQCVDINFSKNVEEQTFVSIFTSKTLFLSNFYQNQLCLDFSREEKYQAIHSLSVTDDRFDIHVICKSHAELESEHELEITKVANSKDQSIHSTIENSKTTSSERDFYDYMLIQTNLLLKLYALYQRAVDDTEDARVSLGKRKLYKMKGMRWDTGPLLIEFEDDRFKVPLNYFLSQGATFQQSNDIIALINLVGESVGAASATRVPSLSIASESEFNGHGCVSGQGDEKRVRKRAYANIPIVHASVAKDEWFRMTDVVVEREVGTTLEPRDSRGGESIR